MKEQIQRYEDRYGSSDFEDGKGANLQKLVDRKEKREMKQNGIKPTDTFADRVKKVIAEENPSKKKKENAGMQDAEAFKYLKSKGLSDENIEKVMNTPYGVDALKQSNNEDEKNEVLDDDGNNQMRDEEEEKRIKIMQYMNPRVVKSSEVKNFMDRTNVKEEIIRRLNELATNKLDLFKKALAVEAPFELEEETEQLDEGNVIRQGRTKIVKARVRGGKVQRRKKLSAVKGYTIRGGKLKRMSAQERIRRKRGQRRGKVKRKAKMARALLKRKRSMRKRAALGIKE